jgi:hypothetical protein
MFKLLYTVNNLIFHTVYLSANKSSMQLRVLAISLLILASGSLFGQADVLMIDFNNGFNSDQSMNQSRVRNRLLVTQNSVTRVNSMPAAISNVTYDQVWVYGNPGALNNTYVTRLVNFINGGGAVYMQSEVSCCNNMAALVQAVMQNSVAGGASMTHNPNRGTYYQWTTHPSISCPPITHYGGAVRVYLGVPMQNRMFIATNGCPSGVQNGDACGVFFRSCDMSSGQGGLVSAGDFNMFMAGMGCGTIGIIGTANRNDMIDMISNLMADMVNCGSCGVVLPVQFSSLTVKAVEETVSIDWTTASESNNALFTVERSTDGAVFDEVSSVPGAGESSAPIDYQVVDEQPLEGISYYRLMQTDFNGKTTYSDIKTVRFGGWGSLHVYHQSDDNLLVVENLPEDLQSCELMTATSQLLDISAEQNGQTMKFETSTLSAGVYLIRIRTRSGRQVVKKAVVME